MSLLLLLRNPSATPGYRTWIGFWVGGLSVSPAGGTILPQMMQHGLYVGSGGK